LTFCETVGQNLSKNGCSTKYSDMFVLLFSETDSKTASTTTTAAATTDIHTECYASHSGCSGQHHVLTIRSFSKSTSNSNLSFSLGGTTWGNNPMVADPWQNHYHQSMAGPTSAFGAVAVAGPQFTSGFGQPYGYAHRPGSLNGRQGFDILPSPTMSGPPPPAGPGAAFVGLNVAMSPRGAATSVQGNFQPGYPHRPTEESLLSSSNATSEGHSGHHNR